MSASIDTKEDCKSEVVILPASYAPQYTFRDSRLKWMELKGQEQREKDCIVWASTTFRFEQKAFLRLAAGFIKIHKHTVYSLRSGITWISN